MVAPELFNDADGKNKDVNLLTRVAEKRADLRMCGHSSSRILRMEEGQGQAPEVDMTARGAPLCGGSMCAAHGGVRACAGSRCSANGGVRATHDGSMCTARGGVRAKRGGSRCATPGGVKATHDGALCTAHGGVRAAHDGSRGAAPRLVDVRRRPGRTRRLAVRG